MRLEGRAGFEPAISHRAVSVFPKTPPAHIARSNSGLDFFTLFSPLLGGRGEEFAHIWKYFVMRETLSSARFNVLETVLLFTPCSSAICSTVFFLIWYAQKVLRCDSLSSSARIRISILFCFWMSDFSLSIESISGISVTASYLVVMLQHPRQVIHLRQHGCQLRNTALIVPYCVRIPGCRHFPAKLRKPLPQGLGCRFILVAQFFQCHMRLPLLLLVPPPRSAGQNYVSYPGGRNRTGLQLAKGGRRARSDRKRLGELHPGPGFGCRVFRHAAQGRSYVPLRYAWVAAASSCSRFRASA